MNIAGISVLPTVVLLLYIQLQWTNGHPVSEPIVYSRFDYESKLLERMVLVEHRMNLLQESTDKELDNLQTEKQTLEETVLRLKQQLEESTDKELDNLQKEKQTLKEIVLRLKQQLEESTEKELDNLQKEKQTLKETVLRLKQQLEEEQAYKIDELEQLAESLVKNVSSHLGDMTKLSETIKEEQKNVLTDALTKLDLKMNTTIQDIYDQRVKPTVAFHTRLSSGASLGANSDAIKFDVAMTNTNNVYNTGTGYFTAPTPGVYMFAIQICGYKNNYTNFRLYVNNDYITDTTAYDANSSSHCTSTNAAAVLEKGDTVCVKTGPNTSPGYTIQSSSWRWSTFTGTLVN